MAKSIEKREAVNRDDSFDPGNVMIVVYVSIICFVLLVGSLVTADAATTETSVSLDDVTRGELLFKGEGGVFIPAPDLFRDVTINVSGLTARVKVKQTFVNGTSSTQEAIYVFPLPDESAVDRLTMMIGERKIIGVIQEKKEAQKTYDDAKREGKKASLLVQKRPNMFTSRVANIGAGETVTVEIEYQQQVQYNDNTFSLRFPLAITPRYTPQSSATGAEGDVFLTGDGWMMDIPLEEQTSPLSLQVNLEAGMELGCVSSVYHQVQEKKNGIGSYQLSYDSSSKNYHDFVLEWQPVEGGAVNAALFSEEGDDGVYSLLMLMPPAFKADYSTLRELIFIVDVSGSMAGTSISQAKASLLHGLDKLKAADSFNIIIFNNTSSALFDEPVLATHRSLEQAKKFVRSLDADGGTEMKPALEMAFGMDSLADEKSRVQQVVFMTDGAVSNEEELFNLIDKRLENRRLFTVGIGSAPNSYFMSRAANMGRGTFTYIGDLSEVQKKIEQLFNKIESPAMTDILLSGNSGESLEYFPSRIPDLYSGEPLVLAVKSSTKSESLSISGMRENRPWRANLKIENGAVKSGISTLWARKKIRSLMDEMVMQADRGESNLQQQITDVALQYQLVSKYTSLVAVEERPVEKAFAENGDMDKAEKLLAQAQPPLFAGSSQTATPAEMIRCLGGLAIFFGLSLLYLLRRRNSRSRI